MWFALAIVMLLTHLVVHESAHALALRKLGGRIREAGLGLPLWPRIVFGISRSRAGGSKDGHDDSDLQVSLSPWLIGAYVEPDEDAVKLIERSRYFDQAWFAGAGVVANVLLAIGSFAAFAALRGVWFGTLLAVVAGVVVWLARKLITAAIPAIGLGALVLLAISLVQSFGEPNGPVGLVRSMSGADGLEMVLAMSTGIGLSLALVNCIPIFPFDGGRVMDAALQRLAGQKVAAVFRNVTTVIALVLVAYSVVSDWL